MTKIQEKIYDTLEPSAKKVGSSAISVMTALQALLLASALIAHKTPLMFALFMCFTEFLAYVIYKDMVSTSARKKMQTMFKIALVLFVANGCATPVSALIKVVGASDPSSAKALSAAVYIMAFVGAAITVALFISDSGKKLFKAIDENLKLGGKDKNVFANEDKGYVVLCKDYDKISAMFGSKDPEELEEMVMDQKLVAETAEKKGMCLDEIIPYEDRFLHTLVLGPTGCGKTSQILIPMCLQDIQNPDIGVTVLEPKGDYAQKAAMMAQMTGRPFLYFDPSIKGCPHFNPMAGKESDVVENMATTFRMLNPDSPTFFLDMDEQLIRNATKVLKRLDKNCGVEGTYANLIQLSRLLQNSGGAGRKLVQELSKVSSPTPEEAKENTDIISWFQNDYFAERSKVYENTSEVRSQVAKITSNEYLREVLNPDPSKGEKNDLDFDKHLEEGGVICISTAQGTLRGLSKFLGYFIILQFQSAVFRRPGSEDTRRPHALYIDEFQTYSTPGFADMLTQGRSYRVASILATQARDQMAMGGGRDGRNFVNLVSTNARNVILFPGCNNDDTEYYSKNFGEYEKTEIQTARSTKHFDLLRGGLSPLGHPTDSVRESKKIEAIFSAATLRFQKNTVITYCIVKHKSLQPAKRGIVSYIPQDMNKQLNQMVADYLEEHKWDEESNGLDKFAMPDFDGSGESVADVNPETTKNILTFNDGVDEPDDNMEEMAQISQPPEETYDDPFGM